MPYAGQISMKLSSVNAWLIADWLEDWRPVTSLFGTRSAPPSPDLAKFFRKFSRRTRSGDPLADREVHVPREYVEWFADRSKRPPLFSAKANLPVWVEEFAIDCRLALYERRGRPRVTGAYLRKRVQEQIDERHKLRLKKRIRDEDAAARSLFDLRD